MNQTSKNEFHSFPERDIRVLRKLLSDWYAINKRDLPWRQRAINATKKDHAYQVLVSEIMCQQTQVSVVRSYFENWISKWPTLLLLSNANLDEVQRAWKGLGYYSRGTRLLKLAKLLPAEKELPESATELAKLPGIGRYTAGAVSSIVFKERVPAVDGNVIRVMCRLRAVGAEISQSNVMKLIWNLAESLVPQSNPGDWNQALMELGATICTPRNPKCTECPVSEFCYARQLSTHDIEDCQICLPIEKSTSSVTDYPRKKKKKKGRDEILAVCIVVTERASNTAFYVVRRESTGLLADLWQFMSFPVKSTSVSSIVREASCSLHKNCGLAKKPKPKIRTLRLNRSRGNDRHLVDLKLLRRGHNSIATNDDNISVMRWMDSKAVHTISTYCGALLEDTVQRWGAKTKTHIEVTRPFAIAQYNKFMGGVDLVDRMIAHYPHGFKNKKWYLRLFFHLLNVSIVNSWILYKKKNNPKDSSMLAFKASVAHTLISSGSYETKRGRPSTSSPLPQKKTKTAPAKIPFEIRYDSIGHYPEKLPNSKYALRCHDRRCKKRRGTGVKNVRSQFTLSARTIFTRNTKFHFVEFS